MSYTKLLYRAKDSIIISFIKIVIFLAHVNNWMVGHANVYMNSFTTF